MSKNPVDFDFPYEPYPIQNEFMTTLYNALSEGKIGIFESPTGTGKSLSLICGSLRWLQDHPDNGIKVVEKKEPMIEFDGDDDEPDWLRTFQNTDRAGLRRQELIRERRQALRERIERIQQGNARRMMDQPSSYIQHRKRQKKSTASDSTIQQHGEDEFLLQEYYSDDEEKAVHSNGTILSKQVRELMAKLDEPKSSRQQQPQDEEEEEEDFGQTKIYYASRTHSQLSQFVQEVLKTKYAKDTLSVSLGSRKNMCIHKDIRKLKSVQQINDACLDLQKTNSKARCPHLPPKADKPAWDDFRDHSLARVRDIEDLVKMGEQMGVCPYYGSRHALLPAQLVVLPYQHLLHANTRESLGISLKDNIVIIDEAHNLIETVTAIHSVSLTQSQIRTALSQLAMYLDRYKARLLGKNVAYIKQIMTIVKALLRTLQPTPGQPNKDRVLGVNDFVHMLNIDHINMFKVEKYLKESKLAQKLNGFVDKEQQKQNGSSSPSSGVPTLTQIESFILTLTNPDKDGRVVLTYADDGPQVKYMLLNPAEVFRPIVDEAKSIILAGGTMEPVSDFTNYLFGSVPIERISRLSCGHIIPPNNMAVMSVNSGPTGKPFLFNFESRRDSKLMDEVGLALINFSTVIPDGVVCFFPSFSYLEQMYAHWQKDGLLERISKKKKIFKEPRETKEVEATLTEYAIQIDQAGGAMLLCVVNGKMSEGINFSDRLGRGVIMIGLPFANAGSAELQEKIKYAREKGSSADAGKEYYENMCMRGVNQSIGRAIRHKNDYATIVLLDQRYSTKRIQNKLPGWIGGRVEQHIKFGKAMGDIARFFRQFRHVQ